MFFYFQLCLSVAAITLTIFIFECTLVSQKESKRENIDFSMVSFFQTFFQRNRKGGGGGKSQKQKAIWTSDRKISVSVLASVCISVSVSVSLHLSVLAEILVQNQTENRNLLTYHNQDLSAHKLNIFFFFHQNFLYLSVVGFKFKL
jgi:hypothetical protein